MKHGSLFSGIGGFDIAAEWMGWNNVFHCEWAEFPRKILSHYWPQAESYHDITSTDFSRHAGEIDILTGGFPCQPYSAAGKRKGKDDNRHLWPHMLRAVREVRPRWVVGENVFGLTTWNGGLVFEEVCADLEAEGYAVQPFIFPAAAVNAPHRRDRVWFVAYDTNAGTKDMRSARENTVYAVGPLPTPRTQTIENKIERITPTGRMSVDGTQRFGLNLQDMAAIEMLPTPQSRDYKGPTGVNRQSENLPDTVNRATGKTSQLNPPICGGDDGLPTELDGITFSKWRAESIKGYGNAIVPQVALQIFQAVEQYENTAE